MQWRAELDVWISSTMCVVCADCSIQSRRLGEKEDEQEEKNQEKG